MGQYVTFKKLIILGKERRFLLAPVRKTMSSHILKVMEVAAFTIWGYTMICLKKNTKAQIKYKVVKKKHRNVALL